MNTIKKVLPIHPSIPYGSGAHLKVLMVGAGFIVAKLGMMSSGMEGTLKNELKPHNYFVRCKLTMQVKWATQLFWFLWWSWNLRYNTTHSQGTLLSTSLLAFAYYQGKDIVFRFIIEYSSLRDFGP